jgi:RND superfamily putative drug exporter
MSNRAEEYRSLSTPNRGLAGFVQRAARVSGRRPKTAIVLWLALIVGLVFAGSSAGTKEISDVDAGIGESGEVLRLLDQTGLREASTENVLVTADDSATAAAAANEAARELGRLDAVQRVSDPNDPDLIVADGKAHLVQVQLRGDPDDDASAKAEAVAGEVDRVAAQHPDAAFEQVGEASLGNAIDDIVADDLGQAEMYSLPLILVILLVAFGALVAASVPLILGVTAVVGALGAAGLVSHIAPASESTASLVVLIGLAVGVDYSLFYIRREREERRRGGGSAAALDAAAATVGRAVVVSGLTVMVALAGLLVTGLAVFESMALGTMVVVLLAVIGSITVLPAVLSLLDHRIDRGRIPFVGRIRRRPGRVGVWPRFAALVARRPVASLVTSVAVLGALAVPAIGMHLEDSSAADLPADVPEVQALHHVEELFPGAPADAVVVVEGESLRGERSSLMELGEQAREITGGAGGPSVRVAGGGEVARISVPMPDMSTGEATQVVERLRGELEAPEGARMLVGGDAADTADYTAKLRDSLPIVIGIVLALAFGLLLAAFRSPKLALAVIALNMLSVGAAYGVLTIVFQHGVGESLLGFTSYGAVVSWIPLFSFVILFGLSMDYTVIVLERIQEARRAGKSAAEAAAEGVGATAGAVTSAAIVMVAVFSLFAMLRLPEMKQLGVGLAAAVLIDATIVRAVALPAVVTLLGERNWRVRPSGARARRPRPSALIERSGDATLRPIHDR